MLINAIAPFVLTAKLLPLMQVGACVRVYACVRVRVSACLCVRACVRACRNSPQQQGCKLHHRSRTNPLVPVNRTTVEHFWRVRGACLWIADFHHPDLQENGSRDTLKITNTSLHYTCANDACLCILSPRSVRRRVTGAHSACRHFAQLRHTHFCKQGA